MGFGAFEKYSKARMAAALLTGLFAQTALATPPSFTGAPIVGTVPGFQQPITINLRQQGVITGTRPIQLTPRSIQFIVDGAPNSLVGVTVVGAVCITLNNFDFTPRPATYELAFGLDNGQPPSVPTTRIRFTNTTGPTVSPQDPSCLDPNSAPTVQASADIPQNPVPDSDGIAGELIQFGTAAFDAQNDRLTYEWFLDGDLQNPLSQSPNPELRIPDGAHRVTVRVTDELGASANDTLSISVIAPTQQPTVNAGPDQNITDTDASPGEDVTLTGTATPPTAFANFQWRLGQTVLGSGQTITTRLADGQHILTFVGTLATGAQVTDQATITVSPPPNQLPTANGGGSRTVNDTDGVAGEEVILDGSASTDPDGQIVNYTWSVPGYEDISTPSPTTTVRLLTDGAIPISLQVRDNQQGESAPASFTITVLPPNRLPIANAGGNRTVPDSNFLPGETVTLDGSGSTDPDPNDTIVSYRWTIPGTAPVVTQSPTLPNIALPDGANTVTLQVTDSRGGVSLPVQAVITVVAPVNRVPVANAGGDRTVPDSNFLPGETVTLDGSASSDPDPSDTIVSYRWTIRGGNPVVTTSPTLPNVALLDGANTITLQVTDNRGGVSSPAQVVITVTAPVNRPPVANAGANRSVSDTDGQAGENVTLDGSASSDPDPNDTIASYRWTIPGREPIVSTTPTVATNLPNGPTTVTLQVTDSRGAVSQPVSVVITVAAPLLPPTANAGPDQTLQDTDGQDGEQVTLSGSGTDPDGTITTYTWLNGPTVLGTGPTLGVRLPDGANTITLRVTDNSGLTATDTVQITVGSPREPTANAGADRTVPDTDGDDGETVTLTGSATTPNTSITEYSWFQGEGLLGTGPTLTVRLGDGVNDITLVVTDNLGLTDDDQVVITVGAPRAPTANAGVDQTVPDTNGVPGETVTLTGTASDPDGTIATYRWSIGATVLGTGATLAAPLGDGVHVVTLTVTDNAGLTATDTVQITVQVPQIAPTANAGPDQTVADTDNVDGELVTLTGTGTDPDGTIAAYQWILGDGTLGTGATIQARIPDGVHTVTLQVTDNAGLTATDTVQITVVASSDPPTANAGADQNVSDTDAQPGESVTLTGTGTDPDGEIASYAWLLGDSTLGTTATLTTRIPDGVSTVTLRVTDNSGLTATDTVQITVTAPARPPTANAGEDRSVVDSDGEAGEVVTLTGTGTDPDNNVATYRWTLGNTELGTTATLQARLPDGVNVVTLTVTDATGLSATDTVQVTVTAPVLPVVDAGISQTIEDSDVQAGEMVTLSGSATSTGSAITQYQWFANDVSIGTGQSIRVRLPDGRNVVTLRATNAAGLTGSASIVITVTTGVRTILSNIPGLTPNEQRLAARLDEACNRVLGPLTPVDGGTQTPEGPTLAQKGGRAPTEAEVADFEQKCRGLLRSRDNTALANAMGALLGDDFAVARTQTLLFANTQYASVMDRLIALRGGAKGLSLAGLNIIVDGEMIPLAELQDLAKQLLGGGASSDADGLWSDKWGLWARGNFSFGEKDRDFRSPSFEADQFALLAGLDYRLSQSAVVGAALAYGNSSVEFDPLSEGSLDTTSYALSMYGSLYAKKNFYFDAIVNVADAGYEAERNITYVDGYGLVSADASGDTGGLTLSGGMSGGYDFLIGGLTISPTIGVFYIDAQIDEFTEAGAGGLNLIYDEQQFKSFTGNLGVRMTFSWNLPFGVLLPHLRADFVREFEDDVDVFGIRFAADPNAASTPPILVETENPDSSYWRLAAGFSAQFKHGISGYVEYQRLESFQFISFQDISLGLRFQAAF